MAGYPGGISGVLKMRVEPGEEFLHRAGPHRGFPEPPDGRLVRRPRAVIEAEETAKGAPVHDLQRHLRIQQTVERLDHRHLEHEDRVHGRPPALPAIGTIKRRENVRRMVVAVPEVVLEVISVPRLGCLERFVLNRPSAAGGPHDGHHRVPLRREIGDP